MIKCNICNNKIKKKTIITRSKKKLKINICNNCDYEFFLTEKKKNLKKNKLDDYRLTMAGLKLPSQEEEFLNGLIQSKEYINKHLKKNRLNILEIGCSLGYFLLSAKRRGHKCTGIEINEIKRDYVNQNLKIQCFEKIDFLNQNKFDKIFLFYSLEYISNPLNYLKKLKELLSKNGEIIIYTPNKNDHINSLTNLEEYNNFFYEENSINYFSPKSLINLSKQISRRYEVKLLQGYSIINYVNWVMHKRPFNTGFVGKDDFVKVLISSIKPQKKEQKMLVKKIKNQVIKLDNFYRKNLIENGISNIILLKIRKK
jgi:2-polyprenyl-3-methyl-5-hydroxy-6-metoxy-1,4-benzoquinol methylase